MKMEIQEKKLTISQWHCWKYENKTGLLQNIANDYDIIILIETWLKPDTPTNLNNNFNFIRKDRIEKKGGYSY